MYSVLDTTIVRRCSNSPAPSWMPTNSRAGILASFGFSESNCHAPHNVELARSLSGIIRADQLQLYSAELQGSMLRRMIDKMWPSAYFSTIVDSRVKSALQQWLQRIRPCCVSILVGGNGRCKSRTIQSLSRVRGSVPATSFRKPQDGGLLGLCNGYQARGICRYCTDRSNSRYLCGPQSLADTDPENEQPHNGRATSHTSLPCRPRRNHSFSMDPMEEYLTWSRTHVPIS